MKYRFIVIIVGIVAHTSDNETPGENHDIRCLINYGPWHKHNNIWITHFL